jgi:hypothetical protein
LAFEYRTMILEIVQNAGEAAVLKKDERAL